MLESKFTVPAPILFHPLKHHLGYLQHFIHNSTDEDFLQAIPRIGASQTDVYCGELSPRNIAQEILEQLTANNLATAANFTAFLAPQQGYYNLSLSDGSTWTLLPGDDPAHYIHIHPARYARHGLRVKAGTLKTAVMMVRQGLTPKCETAQVNALRKSIGLSPIKYLPASEGIERMWVVLSG